MTTPNAGVARNRVSFLLIVALFAAPVGLAWLLFFVFPDWVPTATSNHGTLVTPVRAMPAFEFATLDGGTVTRASLNGKWTLLYLHSGACGRECVAQMYKMRQVRLTQGKNIDRLQRLVFWAQPPQGSAAADEVKKHFPGQVTALLSRHDAAAMQPTFTVDGEPPLGAERLYLVDPLGNLMMLYAADDDPGGMIKDLEKLLKYSGLG